jgi:hypothetical protein
MGFQVPRRERVSTLAGGHLKIYYALNIVLRSQKTTRKRRDNWEAQVLFWTV